MNSCEILAFSALSGLRSMAGPALLARAVRRGDVEIPSSVPLSNLQSRLSPLLQVFIFGEMVFDKTPFIPSRTSPGPLLGRALSGAFVGTALFASAGRPKTLGALLGAISAVAAAHAGEKLRARGVEKLGVPDPVLALLEDGLVLVAGERLSARGPCSRL